MRRLFTITSAAAPADDTNTDALGVSFHDWELCILSVTDDQLRNAVLMSRVAESSNLCRHPRRAHPSQHPSLPVQVSSSSLSANSRLWTSEMGHWTYEWSMPPFVQHLILDLPSSFHMFVPAFAFESALDSRRTTFAWSLTVTGKSVPADMHCKFTTSKIAVVRLPPQLPSCRRSHRSRSCGLSALLLPRL